MGLILASGTGQYSLAIAIGIVLDIAYGPPAGYLHWLPAPFMLLGMLICLLHYFLSSYFREGDSLRI